jgi:membrane protease YdiL (CAAX protease family)
MATTASTYEGDIPGARGSGLGVVKKSALAVLCLAGGVAPLAARLLPGESAEVAYGLVITAVLLALTVLVRRSVTLNRFWELPFAFFVLAVVQVLNNSVPSYFLGHVLHQHAVSGNPLASTVSGIVALARAAGLGLGSIYWRVGRFGRAYVIAIAGFIALYVLVGLSPAHRLVLSHGTITFSRYLALAPALLVLVISNGFQEEFLFRGLFLQRYNAFFGAYVANILQALIFAFAHAGITYTPSALVFILVAVFPLGLVAGYLMRSSDGVVAPAILHAGVDIPIYLAFLTFVL